MTVLVIRGLQATALQVLTDRLKLMLPALDVVSLSREYTALSVRISSSTVLWASTSLIRTEEVASSAHLAAHA